MHEAELATLANSLQRATTQAECTEALNKFYRAVPMDSPEANTAALVLMRNKRAEIRTPTQCHCGAECGRRNTCEECAGDGE